MAELSVYVHLSISLSLSLSICLSVSQSICHSLSICLPDFHVFLSQWFWQSIPDPSHRFLSSKTLQGMCPNVRFPVCAPRILQTAK